MKDIILFNLNLSIMPNISRIIRYMNKEPLEIISIGFVKVSILKDIGPLCRFIFIKTTPRPTNRLNSGPAIDPVIPISP